MAEIVVMRELSRYLGDVARGRWQYGHLDCCTFMADWLIRLGLPDAMADRRGTYATRQEYKSAIKSEGGIVASCRARFAAIGLVETPNPESGNVALVMAAIGRRFDGRIVAVPTGAICTDTRMRSVVTTTGLVSAPLPIVSTWRIARG